MLISINTVKHRADGLKNGTKYTMSENCNILRNSMKTTTNPVLVERYIGSWDYRDNYAERTAFRDMLNTVKEFCLRNDIGNSIKEHAISYIGKNALYQFSNAKHAKELVNEVFGNSDVEEAKPLLEEVNTVIACDRVINNQKALNKKVSLDNTVMRYDMGKISLKECIENMCEQVDSFNMKFKVKYNVALENILYTLSNHNIKCSRSTVLETVTDYFLMKNNKKENIEAMADIIERTSFYNDDDKVGVQYVIENVNKKNELDDILYRQDYYTEEVKQLVKDKLNNVKKTAKKIASSNIFDELKLLYDKKPEKIKAIVNKLYVRSPEQILDELPNFLSWFRTALVLTTFSVSPYLGIISLGVDKFIQMSLQRDHTKKAIDKYNKELSKAENKLDRLDPDSKAYSNCEAYIATLKKNIRKLEEYYDTLKSEKEIDESMNYNSTDPEIAGILNDISVDDMNLTDAQKIYLDVENSSVDVEEYLESEHKKVLRNVQAAMRKLRETYIVNSQFNKLARQGYFTMIDEEEYNRFALANNTVIEDYIGGDNKIFFCIGHCLPLKATDEKYRDKETIRYLLDRLTDILEEVCDASINVLYEGDDEDIYHIYLSYMKPIEWQDDSVYESFMHIDTRKNAALVLALEGTINQFTTYNPNEIMSMIENNIDKYDNDVINAISIISMNESSIINPEELIDILKKEKNRVYKLNESAGTKYSRTSTISECISMLKDTKPKEEIRETSFESVAHLMNINEAIQSIYEYNQSVNETSLKTNVKIVAQKVKNKANILNDKQKQASAQLDNMVDKFQDSIQKDLSNKNREAVIKGRLLPSASAIIKLALASGIAGLANPVLGVITALGGLGAAAAGTKKEKQYILDEIDIQLKLVEKKQQLAESNNDMKSLEELMKIERKLKRERQRIMYRLKNYYPASVN